MSDYDGVEVAWPEVMDGHLKVGVLYQSAAEFDQNGRRSTLRLEFVSPKTGRTESIAVTTGPTYSTEGEHVWTITLDLPLAVVAPSIHYVGHFHSPNPARFLLV